MTGWTIHGNCLAALPELARQKIPIASVVTDGPYGIGFLGKKWDSPDNIVFGSPCVGSVLLGITAGWFPARLRQPENISPDCVCHRGGRL
jgi:hypothetical protein